MAEVVVPVGEAAMPDYFAHSENASGARHALPKHLEDVAEQARAFAEKFGGGAFGYWAGLWHDLGKLDPRFQAMLEAAEARLAPP